MNPRYRWLYLFAALLAFSAVAVEGFNWLSHGHGDWSEIIFPLVFGSYALFMWFHQRGKTTPNG